MKKRTHLLSKRFLTREEILELMTSKSLNVIPLFVTEVNGTFLVAAYQGSISKFDILIKYRQWSQTKWSNLRTPKHIHWAVDILIKLHEEPNKTKEFLNFLLDVWKSTEPLTSETSRRKKLNLSFLIKENEEFFDKFKDLGKRGEYSIKFLVLLAKLLMIQEKTNLPTAYMFKRLIVQLLDGKDIFKIVSTATHNRR